MRTAAEKDAYHLALIQRREAARDRAIASGQTALANSLQANVDRLVRQTVEHRAEAVSGLDLSGSKAAHKSNLGILAVATQPPLPHPDAANQAIGPNMGGRDGIVEPGDFAPTSSGSSSAAPLLLIGGGLLLVVLFARRKK